MRKAKKQVVGWKSIAVFGGASLLLASCMSIQNNSTLEAIQGAIGAAQGGPFVEAYIEYPGPQEKWSGPQSFMLHVTAKDASEVEVATVPTIFTQKSQPGKGGEGPTIQQRVPASAVAKISREEARGQLARLATAVKESEVAFSGCLYPVRVRLIRADGALVEKTGCRSQTGWPVVASEMVNAFMVASTSGGTAQVPVVRAPVPLAAKGAEEDATRHPASAGAASAKGNSSSHQDSAGDGEKKEGTSSSEKK